MWLKRALLQAVLYRSFILLPSASAHRAYYTPPVRMSVTSASGGTTPYSIALVTCPDTGTAKKLSKGLIENRLAACVNIVPQVTSVYEWEGKVEEDSESLMIIKTQSAHVLELTSYIQTNHPYDVPEIISMKIDQGSEDYLSWVGKCTQKASS